MNDREVFVLANDVDETALVKDALKDSGCNVRTKPGLPSVLRALKDHDIVFLSLQKGGVAAMKEIHSYYPDAVVLLADEDGTAEAAIRDGAYDFIGRPLDKLKLRTVVRNAMGYSTLMRESQELRLAEAPHLVASRNEVMQKAVQRAERASTRKAPVLLLGETGTGKENLARFIHFSGPRAAGPFVSASIAEGIEQELFGKETSRGISHGSIAASDGGTLYIENLDKAPGGLRQRLVALIKEGTFTPEGGNDSLRLDVRLICSANSLEKGSVLYKAVGTRIVVPPLRERPEDVVPLAEHFLREACEELETGPRKMLRDARQYLRQHTWPGNSGELKNAIKKACLLTGDQDIERRHLASGPGVAYCTIREFLEDKLGSYLAGIAKLDNGGLYDTVTSEVEKSLIELVLQETKGNQLKASRTLGMNRNTLRSKIKLYRIRNGNKPR